MIISLTKHAVDRGRDRMNLSEDALRRTAQKAFKHGVHQDQAKGQLRYWMQGSMISNANHMRVMGHYGFLFNDSTLVTILIVPSHCRPKVHAMKQVSHLSNRPEEDFEEEDLEEGDLPYDIR